MLKHIVARLVFEMDQIERAASPQAWSSMSVSPIATDSNCGSNRRPITEAACRSARFFRRKAIYARSQQASVRLPVGPPPPRSRRSRLACVRAQNAALGEKAHDFFGEQWIAVGFLDNLPRQRLGQSLNPEPRLDQAANVALGSGSRRNLVTTCGRAMGARIPAAAWSGAEVAAWPALSTILPKTSSDTLSIQCKSSISMTTGE